ncbi:MAG: hypothetical protein JJU36_05735 [Phycisphaeraceae bacterium]|nr:hypothetical protein [Phycisphaeraceae bacterium]
MQPRVPNLVETGSDRFELGPRSMRVYPSTRIVGEPGSQLIEARLEFLDAAGDSTKAVGRARLDLFPVTRQGEIDRARRVHRWEIDVLTLTDQRRFYDPITRAYLFRLQLPDTLSTGARLGLEAFFKPTEGEPMEAGFRLTVSN